MVEQDGRTHAEIDGAIRWSQDHEFWRGVILSAGNLRKHFDAMQQQARRPSAGGSRVAQGNAAVLQMLKGGAA